MKLKYYLRGLGTGIIISTIILSLSIGRSKQADLSDDEIMERAQELGMEMQSSGVNVDYDAINESINGTSEDEDSADTESSDSDSADTESSESDDSELDVQEDESEDSSKNSESEADPNLQEESSITSELESNVKDNVDALENGADAEDEEDKDEDSENKTSNQNSSSKKENEESSDNLSSDSTEKENSDDSADASEETEIEELPVTKTITIRPGMTAKQVCQLLEDQGVIASADSFNLYLLENSLTEKVKSKKIEIAVNSDYKTIASLITD